MYSDWDADLEEQDWKNLEMKEQKNHDNKTPQSSPKPTSFDTLTLQPSIPSIDRFGNQISASSEMEDPEDIDYICKKHCIRTKNLSVHKLV